MDLDDFRSILDDAGVDVWTFIDTAILVASLDYGQELKQRRDNIVERLYATSVVSRCRHCDLGEGGRVSVDEVGDRVAEDQEREPKRSVDGDEDDEMDPYGGLFDDEQKKVLEIKEQLEDPDQSEDSLVELLQSLADLDITFNVLQETDIGRHVSQLRKHQSNNVKRLAKQLVRKWKETVDEWVKLNPPAEFEASALTGDGDSPQQLKTAPNGHQRHVPDFAYSPNPQNGSSGSDKNNSEPERKPKPIPPPPRRESQTPAKPSHSAPAPQNSQRQREQRERRESEYDLASAAKRLQMNYREAENAKKQRTIQVMDIHEIPKPKKGFFPKKGGGGGSHGRHW